MRKIRLLKIWILLVLSLLPCLSIAENLPMNSLCPVETIDHPQAGKVLIWQHHFDGVFDLAMAPETPSGFAPIIRLSFSGSKEPVCHFSSVAVHKGGNWGWHVAWGSKVKTSLMVVRVDGEAWVSSLPKKLASQTAYDIAFSEKDGLLTLDYYLLSDAVSLKHTMTSSDEGRNWDTIDLHQ